MWISLAYKYLFKYSLKYNATLTVNVNNKNGQEGPDQP